MKVKSYRFKGKQNTFITVEAMSDLDGVPNEIKTKFGGLELFKELDLEPNDKPRIAFDTDKALADIQKQGYYIHATEVRIEVKSGRG